MKTSWTIQQELIALGKQWPLLTLAFLASGLLGWLLAWALPPDHRASARLYVAFNGDVAADVIARTPDDYKNWQMRQLEAFLISEPILAEIRATLREGGLAIDESTFASLPRQLSIGWQNAGIWTLVARHPRPEVAEALASAWLAAALEQIAAAQPHAHAVLQLERDLRITANRRYQAQARQLIQTASRRALADWQARLEETSETAPLDELERWQLYALSAPAIGDDPAGLELIDNAPRPRAPRHDYLTWISQTLVVLDRRIESTGALIDQLTESESGLYVQWQAEQRAARGLTAFLYVEPLDGGYVTVQPVRTAGAASLVGGFCGLIAFLLFRLARVSLSKAA